MFKLLYSETMLLSGMALVKRRGWDVWSYLAVFCGVANAIISIVELFRERNKEG